jgi:putative acetyltransferase
MPTPPFDWRPAVAADVPALAALYRDAAQRLGPLVYTAGQVAAWASFAADAEGFRKYVLDADTWVAERAIGPAIDPPDDRTILGFCGVSLHGDVGEVHSLYVAPPSTRRGLGTEMLARTLRRAEAAGARRFAAWVTPFSRPVFLRAGFVLVQTVDAPFAGTMFERYRVERG